MILNNEIEIPSWTSLFNRKVCTRGLKTKKEISDQISLITGIEGCLYFLKFENKVSNYFFFFKTKNNDYFVKLIDNYQLNKIQSSLKLSSWLSKKGINTVNPCFPIKKVDTENQKLNAVIFPFVKNQSITLNLKNICSFSKSLANFHNILEMHPANLDYKKNTIERMKELKKIETLIKNDKLKIKKFGRFIKTQLKDFSIQEIINEKYYQILHGDLNSGNILINNNKIYFIDFEDSMHSSLNPIFELMYVIERFILVNKNLSYERKLSFSQTFYEIYKNSRKNLNFKICMYRVTKLNILKSLLILSLYKSRKVKTHQSEWEKFIYLWKLSDKHEVLLKSIY